MFFGMGTMAGCARLVDSMRGKIYRQAYYRAQKYVKHEGYRPDLPVMFFFLTTGHFTSEYGGAGGLQNAYK